MSNVRVLFCASEMAPYAKTGGLADVVGALPAALKARGAEVACVVPLYSQITNGEISHTGQGLTVRLGTMREDFGIRKAERDGVPIYFLESQRLFDRPGIYGEGGQDYPDNCRRFALFSRACLDVADYLGLNPDVFHVHDWQTALLPVYLSQQAGRRARSLLTIHNLAYQGLVPAEYFHRTGLDRSYYHWQRLEFYGKANLLKGGIIYADAISTVSPTYSREIQRRELGCGLEGVLAEKADRLFGILNGIDRTAWNPEGDELLPAAYGIDDLSGKATCREALFARAGIESTPKPIFGIVTRLAEQKGLEILLPVLRTLLTEGYPIAVLGTGDPIYERELEELKTGFPTRLGLFLTFDNALAHLIEAGSDMFLMPSRFEPCGLNQFYSMRYGTLPIVRATGGLADSVHPYSRKDVEAGRSCGFVFRPYDTGSLLETVREAIAVFADKKVWSQLVRNAMRQQFGWDASAQRYLELYRELGDT